MDNEDGYRYKVSRLCPHVYSCNWHALIAWVTVTKGSKRNVFLQCCFSDNKSASSWVRKEHYDPLSNSKFASVWVSEYGGRLWWWKFSIGRHFPLVSTLCGEGGVRVVSKAVSEVAGWEDCCNWAPFLVLASLKILVWCLRPHLRHRYLELQWDTLWWPKQLKHNLSCFIMCKRFCWSLATLQLPGVWEPVQ